jgi:hypothetical protein
MDYEKEQLRLVIITTVHLKIELLTELEIIEIMDGTDEFKFVHSS